MSSARDYGLTVVKMSGGEELVLCPWHSDSKPSAWFNPKEELFYCAVCNLGLNSYQLAQRLGLDLEEIERDDQEIEDYVLVSEEDQFELGGKLYDLYIANRGVSRDVFLSYPMGFRVRNPRAAILHITNSMGYVTGTVERFVEPEEAGTRYKTHGKTQPVWPMHFLHRHYPGCPVIVTEGAWSALKMATVVNYQDAVFLALLGAKANQDIVDVLSPFDPVILYDGDKAGTNACNKMRKLAPNMHSFTLPVSPDDLDETQIKLLMTKIERAKVK